MVKNSDAEVETFEPKNKKRRRSRKKKSQPEEQKTPAITEGSKHRKKTKKKSKEKEIKTSDEENEGFRISNMVENSNAEIKTGEQKKKKRKRKKKSQSEEQKPQTPAITEGSKHRKKKKKKSEEKVIKTSDEEDEDYYVKKYPDLFVAEDMLENYFMELAQMHTSQEYMAYMSECTDPFLESSDGESLSEMLKYMHIVSDTDDHDTDGGKIDIKYYDGKPRSKRIEALESKEICNEVSNT